MQLRPSFLSLVNHAWHHSPYYRELYSRYGIHEDDLPAIQLSDLPLVTKEMLMENFNDVVTDQRLRKDAILKWVDVDKNPHNRYLDEYIIIYSSGGSSLVGLFVYDRTAWGVMTTVASGYLHTQKRGESSTRIRNAFLFGAHGHYASMTSATLTSPALIESLILTLFDSREEVIAQLNAFQPDRLSSYASGINLLVELAMEGHIKISPREIVVSGEILPDFLRGRIKKLWGSRIYDLYATVESLFIGIRRDGEADWMLFDELNILEALDKNNHPVDVSETGRAVLTSLYNRAFPLIRYELKDYITPGNTLDGRPTLKALSGRMTDDLPVLLDDGGVGAIPAYRIIKPDLPLLDFIQYVTHEPGFFEVEYGSTKQMDSEVTRVCRQILTLAGAGRTEFSVRRIDHMRNMLKSSKFTLVRKPDDVMLDLCPISSGMDITTSLGGEAQPVNLFIDFKRECLESNLIDRFKQQCLVHQDGYAVLDGDEKLTYGDLDLISDRIKDGILSVTRGKNIPIGLFFKPSAGMVSAILGTLKAGGFYLPLDPYHPFDRNREILQDSGAALVVTDARNLDKSQACCGRQYKIINIEDLPSSVNTKPDTILLQPGNPACLLYTSGSTGRPKGVLLDHQAILHRVMLYTNDYHINDSDHLSSITSYIYSASLRDIFGAILNGACLHLYDPKKLGITRLADWLIDQRITIFYCTPSIFRSFINSINDEKFDDLRLIRLGGETVNPGDVSAFQTHFGRKCLLANGLAATETDTICQYFMNHETRVVGAHVPVGYPVEDKRICLVDDRNEEIESGTVGEIVVESAYLGPGYWPITPGKQAQNDQKRPPMRRYPTGDLAYRLTDGRLVSVGRKDWLVKVRGHRTNLMEIERVLLELEDIQEAVCTTYTASDGSTALAAYLVSRSSRKITEAGIRSRLQEKLPEVMIPSLLILMDQLPHLPGGKIDRLRLPYPAAHPKADTEMPISPRTPLEAAMASIWEEVLGIEQVGLQDDFFELGGHSLAALHLAELVNEKLGCDIPLEVIFQAPGLAQQVDFISDKVDTKVWSPLVKINSTGSKTPFFCVSPSAIDVITYRELIKHLSPDQPFYALYSRNAFILGEYYGDSELVAQFIQELQKIQPHGPYLLGGYSSGGNLAFEMAHMLRELGENTALVFLFDTFGPGYPERLKWVTPGLFRFFRVLRRIESYLWKFSILSWKGKIDLLFSRRRPFLLRAGRWFKKRYSELTRSKGPMNMGRIRLEKAIRDFQPDRFIGKVVLLRARKSLLGVKPSLDLGWKKWLPGGLEIHEVPGDHESILFGPRIEHVAEILKKSLDGATRKNS